jgi:hypothetical protein
VSAWSRPAERTACLLASALALASSGAAQDPVASVREAYDRGRLDQALERVAAIEDPSLREQWKFHVLFAGGDLISALESSLSAVREHPQDAALLGNAATVATTLGQGALADNLCRRWRAAIDAQALDDAQKAPMLARAGEIGAQAREAADVDAASQRALRAARIASVALLAASCVALAALTRWGSRSRTS